jgi:hypothetical protein
MSRLQEGVVSTDWALDCGVPVESNVTPIDVTSFNDAERPLAM